MPRMVRKLSKSESLLNEQILALLESAADDPKRWHEIGTLSLTKKPGFRNIDSCAEANGAHAERVASNRSARFQSIGGAAPEKTISNAVMRRATPARSSAPATRRTVTSSEPARSIAPQSRRPGFTLASNSWEVRSGIGTLRARRCPRCPLATLFTLLPKTGRCTHPTPVGFNARSLRYCTNETRGHAFETRKKPTIGGVCRETTWRYSRRSREADATRP
jgi:hypothetical protein